MMVFAAGEPTAEEFESPSNQIKYGATSINRTQLLLKDAAAAA